MLCSFMDERSVFGTRVKAVKGNPCSCSLHYSFSHMHYILSVPVHVSVGTHIFMIQCVPKLEKHIRKFISVTSYSLHPSWYNVELWQLTVQNLLQSQYFSDLEVSTKSQTIPWTRAQFESCAQTHTCTRHTQFTCFGDVNALFREDNTSSSIKHVKIR